MVLTFNKRELLDFPNWVKKEWSFPEEDYVLIPVLEYTDLQFKKVLNFLELEHFTVESKKPFNDFLLNFDKSRYNILIHFKAKTFISQSVDIKSNWRVKLTPSEFKKMSSFYNLDFFDTDSLEYWLKHEKGIEFIKDTITHIKLK